MKRIIETGLLLMVSSIATAQKASQPNIIIFLVDDMGLMDTSVPFITDDNGTPVKHPLNERYRTPNMEAMAEQGVRFSNFYTQSVSSPSRVSIMTGQNSARHGVTNWIMAAYRNPAPFDPAGWNWEGLDSNTITIPRQLKEQGYRTIHVGKAHFGARGYQGEDPCNIGFDVNIAGCGIGHPGSYLPEDHYDTRGKGDKYVPTHMAVPDLDKYHNTDTFLTEALTLEANAQIEKAVKDGKPFFLNMAHYAVHSPFHMDKRFDQNYEDENLTLQEKQFATLIEGMDKSLGDIMAKVRELGIGEDTFIIFLGDNGSDAPVKTAASKKMKKAEANEINTHGHASSAPLRGKKATEFEGGVRTAFIASWVDPNKENKNQRKLPIAIGETQLQSATIMDIYPTILSLAGAKNPKGHIVDGIDLKRQLANKFNRKHSDEILMHFPHTHRTSYFTTLIDGEWKFIYYYNPNTPEKPSCKLFNLEKDPFEDNDLSQSEREIRLRLNAKMINRLKEQNAKYPEGEDGTIIYPTIIE